MLEIAIYVPFFLLRYHIQIFPKTEHLCHNIKHLNMYGWPWFCVHGASFQSMELAINNTCVSLYDTTKSVTLRL